MAAMNVTGPTQADPVTLKSLNPNPEMQIPKPATLIPKPSSRTTLGPRGFDACFRFQWVGFPYHPTHVSVSPNSRFRKPATPIMRNQHMAAMNVTGPTQAHPTTLNLCILVYLVIYDSGQVSLEHLLLSRHPYQP